MVKRYRFSCCVTESGPLFVKEPCEDGRFVEYLDYEKLEAKLAEAERRCEGIEEFSVSLRNEDFKMMDRLRNTIEESKAELAHYKEISSVVGEQYGKLKEELARLKDDAEQWDVNVALDNLCQNLMGDEFYRDWTERDEMAYQALKAIIGTLITRTEEQRREDLEEAWLKGKTSSFRTEGYLSEEIAAAKDYADRKLKEGK